MKKHTPGPLLYCFLSCLCNLHGTHHVIFLITIDGSTLRDSHYEFLETWNIEACFVFYINLLIIVRTYP